MELEFVRFALQDGIARLTLSRAPLNLINLSMLREIEACIEGLGDPPSCRALRLDAEGSAFSYGLDPGEQERSNIFLQLEQFHGVIRLIDRFPRPTIAVVRGMALGAGNELLAFCDFVLASERAAFGHPEIKVGSMPSLAPLVLPILVGQRRALQMVVTGELVDAPEAARIGLIDRALPESALDRASAPPTSRRSTTSSRSSCWWRPRSSRSGDPAGTSS
jgi:enoyl-CoA hydratase/carnithine racemase